MIEQAAPFFVASSGAPARLERWKAAVGHVRGGLESGDATELVSGLQASGETSRRGGTLYAYHTQRHPARDLRRSNRAKATGACGGGFVIAYLPQQHRADTLAALKQNLGSEFSYFTTSLRDSGVASHAI